MHQVPGTSYVVYFVLVMVCGFIPDHHRGSSEIPCLHHNLGLSQNPPAGVPSLSVPTGLCRHSHQLQLRLHKKKKTKQTENSARMHSIEGNNNITYGIEYYLGFLEYNACRISPRSSQFAQLSLYLGKCRSVCLSVRIPYTPRHDSRHFFNF